MANRHYIHWAWVILGTCFMNIFINYSIQLGYALVLPQMIADLHFTRTAAATVFNAYLLSYIILTPFNGMLTDRFGARLVIPACAFILGVGTILMGTVRSLWTAILCFTVVGIGSTGMWAPVVTVVQRWVSTKRRGLALGILSSGCGIGFATLAFVFPWLVSNYTWRYSWYALGTGALIMVVVNALILRDDPDSLGLDPWGQELQGNPSYDIGYGSIDYANPLVVLKQRTFWIIGLSYFCICYSLYGITTFMVDYARFQLGLPLQKASFLATVHGLGQVVGVLTITPLSDYLGRKNAIMISNLFVTMCLGGILLSGASWAMLYVFVGILAAFYGATFPMYGACAGDYFPKEIMATVLGAWTPFYGIGAISAHWITGLLRDNMRNYTSGFLINLVMAGLSLLLISAIKTSGGNEVNVTQEIKHHEP